jgi:hypothetical protein
LDILTLILLGTAVAFSILTWRNSVRALASPKVKPALLPAPTPDEHKLVRTWVEANNYPGVAGWKWKCSCGVQGTAPDANGTTSLGSESKAIDRYMAHAKNYKIANGNKWKDKHDEVKEQFDAFVEKCYCKETHQPLQLERQ